LKDANNLQNIKDELRKRGYDVPLIADIHFTPNAAEAAAKIVEKVRVNPGNYVDKKKFQQIEYTDAEYSEEIERIRKRFTPLVKICKEYGTAMRIGTNHGSLSDRIMSRYGDTPLGMVESALEFVRICEELDYHEIVLSMKASNTQVMVQAYRLLINMMEKEGMNYPIHLGVTEAGDGEDGRIKSAVGIGTLLEDGIGDTIRVSLTEEPENEAPVAIALAERYRNRETTTSAEEMTAIPKNPFEYFRRESFEVAGIGGKLPPIVVADFGKIKLDKPEMLIPVGYTYSEDLDKWNMSDQACDLIYLGSNSSAFDVPRGTKAIFDYQFWISLEDKLTGFPIYTLEEFASAEKTSFVVNFVKISIEDLSKLELKSAANNSKVVFVISTENEHAMPELRSIFFEFLRKEICNPVIIFRNYKNIGSEEFQIYSSTDFGGLLIGGFGDGVWVGNESILNHNLTHEFINRTLFGILQASRVRISKTEYIACPSCGRTLFDLVEVTNKIRERTGHLKGVKIGIMGCIVNGPGEMADADYGYVGSGIDKITLYKGKEVVRKGVKSEFAVDELINIIKEDDNWIEPK
jgi:(E)-4-hydroxy-3-methylbut-2-enyl-diphosphate synthase